MKFDGLAEVDWSSLSHAHAVGTDVPRMLESLCSADPMIRSEACSDLFVTVWHQGTIYSASSDVLPFLFQIVSQGGTYRSDQVNGQYIPSSGEMAVGLICSIVTGEGWLTHALGVSGVEQVTARLESQARSLEIEQEMEARTLQAIRQIAKMRKETLRTYLGSPEGLGEIVAETLTVLES